MKNLRGIHLISNGLILRNDTHHSQLAVTVGLLHIVVGSGNNRKVTRTQMEKDNKKETAGN